MSLKKAYQPRVIYKGNTYFTNLNIIIKIERRLILIKIISIKHLHTNDLKHITQLISHMIIDSHTQLKTILY